ncbi:MAG: hypothetical protein R3321_03010 [Nitrososphaeraceae archaeon]|nr:hypothetical protein [Nitrososphaeraceae archaeon]
MTNRKQLRHQDRLEELLARSPIPKEDIRACANKYLKTYGRDKYIEGYAVRYNQHLFLEMGRSAFDSPKRDNNIYPQ